jgi:CHAD domain-containing protein
VVSSWVSTNMPTTTELVRTPGAPPSTVSSRFAAPHPAPPSANPLADYVAAQRDAIVRTYPAVVAEDPDAVHDMRVATRRLRATVKTYARGLERDSLAPLEEELRWLGGLLGDVRDGDVMSRRLAAAIAEEPPELVVGPVAARVRQRLTASTRLAWTDLRDGLESPRLAKLLDLLDSLVTAPTRKTGGRQLRRLAGRAVRRADRRLDRAMRPVPRMAPSQRIGYRDAALHDARKAYKRARYAVEVLRPVVGRPARRLAKRLTALQDVLGAHQDGVVTQELLRDYGMRAFLDGENAFTYGVLQARQHFESEQQLTLLPATSRRAGRPALRAFLR